jgi:hypothetical protein
MNSPSNQTLWINSLGTSNHETKKLEQLANAKYPKSDLNRCEPKLVQKYGHKKCSLGNLKYHG